MNVNFLIVSATLFDFLYYSIWVRLMVFFVKILTVAVDNKFNKHFTKNITCQVPQSELDADTVKSILSEYKIHNADITLKYDSTTDDLIDVVEGNRIYVPCIYILNKIGKHEVLKVFMGLIVYIPLLDQISIEELDVIYKIPHCVPISAHHRWNFDDLLERMWEYLKLVRM